MVNRGYRDLIAWQKAMELTKAVYRDSEDWPKSEQFGLTAQTRRSAVSVPANIAEGAGRSGRSEFAHHLSIAHGSLCEVETLLELAISFGYLDNPNGERLMDQAAEVGRLVRGLLGSIKTRSA